MTNLPSLYTILAIPFWVITLLTFAFILRQVCSIFGEDMPPYGQAILSVVLVASAGYFTYDLVTYGIFLTLKAEFPHRLPNIQSYGQWFQVQLYFKWQVSGVIPGIQFVPVIMAVCVAGMGQVFALQLRVPFRKTLLMFVIQWIVNVLVLVLFTYLFNLGLWRFTAR